jgi:hypothetical protein
MLITGCNRGRQRPDRFGGARKRFLMWCALEYAPSPDTPRAGHPAEAGAPDAARFRAVAFVKDCFAGPRPFQIDDQWRAATLPDASWNGTGVRSAKHVVMETRLFFWRGQFVCRRV